MLVRRIFVLLLATILVGRTLHCCYVEASLCTGAVAQGDAGHPPLRNPNDSDPNETGCICKGVVVNAPAPFDAVRASLESLHLLAAPPESCAVAGAIDAPGNRPVARHLLGPPPLGGKALRAYFGSLLI